MTNNPYGLKIELNVSNDIAYLENILSHQANKPALIGCHNFYPQKFTGLPYDYFIRCSERFKNTVFARLPLLRHMQLKSVHGILMTDYVR